MRNSANIFRIALATANTYELVAYQSQIQQISVQGQQKKH